MHITNFNNIVSCYIYIEEFFRLYITLHPFRFFLILRAKKKKMTTYLRIIPILHLIVEHVEIGLRQWFFLAFGNRCYMRIIRFLRVP